MSWLPLVRAAIACGFFLMVTPAFAQGGGAQGPGGSDCHGCDARDALRDRIRAERAAGDLVQKDLDAATAVLTALRNQAASLETERQQLSDKLLGQSSVIPPSTSGGLSLLNQYPAMPVVNACARRFLGLICLNSMGRMTLFASSLHDDLANAQARTAELRRRLAQTRMDITTTTAEVERLKATVAYLRAQVGSG